MRDLSRLLRPRSIAVLGGVWAENVVRQLRRGGFKGAIWPVHPRRLEIAGLACLPDLDALPHAPDAAFIGVNREATVDLAGRLAAMGAGGAIAFASGFREAEAEAAGGAALQARLVAAAGAMPLLGPNCYGLINYLDAVALWPDQHGGRAVASGVALVSQSSNIAINLTMQRRGLPVAYVLTAGNQAQTGLAELAYSALADPRVTALGLYVEGFGDLAQVEAMAAAARAAGKPVVAIKAGRSGAAQAATLTHTASLAGAGDASSAFMRRLGIIEVRAPAALLETLKLLHFGGPLRGAGVVSVSCSGGEASLMADLAEPTAIAFPPFPAPARAALADALGPIVTIANPLDYHTFIWGDTGRMTAAFAAALAGGHDLGVFVLDLPRGDRCDASVYDCAVAAILAARAASGARVAVLASLPEALDEPLIERLLAGGVTPLLGFEDGLAAIDAAIVAGRLAARAKSPPVLIAPAETGGSRVLSEAEAKAALARFGLRTPRSLKAADPDGLGAACGLNFPLALKALGVAHKTEAGGVALGIADAGALVAAARRMGRTAAGYLVEEMVGEAVAEILVGVRRDASGLMVLTLGAGGVLAELLRDTATLILPVDRAALRAEIAGLRVHALLAGHRGRPAADIEALLDAVMAIADYACAKAPHLIELDVNPIIATPTSAVAVDALISLSQGDPP